MCVAALSVLCARFAPPNLPHDPLKLTFHSLADHDVRQCFDHEDPVWTAAPSPPQDAPPLIVSTRLTRAADVLVEFVADGWHYNRPPPLG